MNDGEMTLCGFHLTKDDIVVKREFNGDAKVNKNNIKNIILKPFIILKEESARGYFAAKFVLIFH